ncbi:MAG: VOC family protein [Clostridiales bacterium]|jgi:catechol 2,3-dioxygenase-like lactoylglutathione lyase family enzyme|nr:VOC family protein [Clostridiales bacterium]
MNDNISGLQHIGIPCKDKNETAEFYCKLGFTKAFETTNNGQPVCFLKLGSLIIETYQDKTVGSTGAINHFCLDVNDIEEAYKTASEMHLNMCDQSIQFLPFWDNGVRFFTITGPTTNALNFARNYEDCRE